MPTQQKVDLVQEIKGRLERSSITMTANYAGITVNEMIELRRAMRAGGVEFTIIKNTLLSLAADEANKPQLKEIIQGPTAVAIGYDDPVEAAKAMADYVRTGSSSLAIIGAVMGDGAAMSPSEFTRLASLPPKPVILAMLLGQLNSPIARLVTVMNGPMQGLGNVLAARLHQLEAEAPAPAPEPEPEPAASEPEASAEADEAPVDEAPVDETPAEEAEPEAEAEAAEEEPATEAEPEAEAAGEEGAE